LIVKQVIKVIYNRAFPVSLSGSHSGVSHDMWNYMAVPGSRISGVLTSAAFVVPRYVCVLKAPHNGRLLFLHCVFMQYHDSSV